MSYAVIFDVDGVLVDSYEAHYESWRRLAQELGATFSEGDFAATFGQRSADIIKAHGLATPGDVELIARLDAHKEELYRAIVSEAFPVTDGAIELIDALGHAGFAIGAGSSGPPENIELTLGQLDRRSSFRAVVTGEDVTRGKPDPQVFLLAAEALGLAPARCAVIEDAAPGIAAAHAAGMKCVGLVSTGRTRQELGHADLVVESLLEVTPDRLRRLIDAR
jgi:beta-phosphoglucomutase